MQQKHLVKMQAHIFVSRLVCITTIEIQNFGQIKKGVKTTHYL
jgi:hypothetical protein